MLLRAKIKNHNGISILFMLYNANVNIMIKRNDKIIFWCSIWVQLDDLSVWTFS